MKLLCESKWSSLLVTSTVFLLFSLLFLSVAFSPPSSRCSQLSIALSLCCCSLSPCGHLLRSLEPLQPKTRQIELISGVFIVPEWAESEIYFLEVVNCNLSVPPLKSDMLIIETMSGSVVLVLLYMLLLFYFVSTLSVQVKFAEIALSLRSSCFTFMQRCAWSCSE